MPQSASRLPSKGDTVILNADPREVGLRDVAQYGDRLEVISSTIDEGGLYLTVRPYSAETTCQLAAADVAPPDGSF